MRALLSQGLSELGLDVSRAETLERFSSLLLEKNNVMNLTAITEPDAVAQLHLLDSAALLPFVDLTGKTVIDVGTGAGFPGMPLRILKDDFDLTLLDSLGKRVNWLSEVCDELQLKRVACVHARAEEFAMQHREQFDIVLLDPPFRNGTLEKILPAVDKCTAPGGIVLCESETGIVLPAEAGGLTLKKQYKYGRVLLWKYTKPMQNTDPAENEPKGEAL